VLSFSIDDDCRLEQVTAILPEVASYETGLLDFLLRGELTINIGAQVTVTAKGLGAGTVEVLVEDGRGVRAPIGSAQVPGGKPELLRIATPARGTRIVAVFRGADSAGEPIVAVGAMPLSSR
jgi:hypothetical protein